MRNKVVPDDMVGCRRSICQTYFCNLSSFDGSRDRECSWITSSLNWNKHAFFNSDWKTCTLITVWYDFLLAFKKRWLSVEEYKHACICSDFPLCESYIIFLRNLIHADRFWGFFSSWHQATVVVVYFSQGMEWSSRSDFG